MAQFYTQHQQPYDSPHRQPSAQNLQFYPSSYSSVSGHTTPSQISYGGYGAVPPTQGPTFPVGGGGYAASAFGSPTGGVSGRMGEQGGLRTGWLAAFGTEGYEGEPPLLEELGVNFEHIRTKVSLSPCSGGILLISSSVPMHQNLDQSPYLRLLDSVSLP